MLDFNEVGLPKKIGLYDPAYEKDACGVGFIVSIDGISSRKVLTDAKTMLIRMAHRGACSCDNDSGDGAGLLTSMPDVLFRNDLKCHDILLPEVGKYAVGVIFLDNNEETSSLAENEFTKLAENCNLKIIYWRTVPANSSALGSIARKREPLIKQAFIVDNPQGTNNEINNLNFTKRCFFLRKQATHLMNEKEYRFYICSLSADTIVYKALVKPNQLWEYYLDFNNEGYQVYLALVHSRFSTNTFPSWERAHPYRFVAHNGEINTLQGNINYMNAREGVMRNDEFGNNIKKLYPIIEYNQSDSGCVDNVIEFLVHCGNRSLPEAMITLVPEAWQFDENMSDLKKAYYKWSSMVMEPWDGPALLTFTDGRYIGAILDRNGLRPSRYYLLKSNHLIMASEVGVIDVDGFEIAMKGRLKPGRMLLVDTLKREFTSDEKIKNEICRLRPVQEWLNNIISLNDLYSKFILENEHTKLSYKPEFTDINEDRRLQLFGYNIEILNILLLPMIKNSKESLGSMGNDTPLACLSDQNPVIYDYFQQLFAQVTNPPIDPIREKIVMSLSCPIGPESNILEPNASQCQRLFLEQPVLSLEDMTVIKSTNFKNLKPKIIDITADLKDYDNSEDYLTAALDRICKECEAAAKENYTVLILSDRNVGEHRLPVSALLALGCVHHYLILKRLRMKVALIIETGEAREIHHICLLLGYGADAICPYLVFETVCCLNAVNLLNTTYTNDQIFSNYINAVKAGISKVMAKMGISTLQSYKGAQIFEAVGVSKEVIDKCFINTASRLGGVTFKLLSKEAYNRHLLAYGSNHKGDDRLAVNPGAYHWRSGGEKHINDPETIAALQDASKTNSRAAYKKFSQFHTNATKNCTIRGQMEIIFDDKKKIDIDSVEPASEIVKRFATGAMSFGSISIETHSTLAKAMNKIGAKSNTGEGGENLERLLDDENRTASTRSSIKQVASGRFGVTSVYLSHADDLQIKMAQGAKPGEGGELPGYKVTEDIAKCRNSIPGVGLISPPPHHDIYSIEDLAELIYDLKCANPKARISVKLVSEVGVGVVASGVAKGKAEHIVISGHDGGTGASSWTGIKHAGLPWELGIAETHQTLLLNDLRSRVVLQADGQIRTGLDVVIAALLGADEFGFATAPLIALGCIMMRKCHLNTCPVGIATQDPVLREKFAGKPEHVLNYFFLLAEEIRELMAKLGFKKFQDMIGRIDKLSVRKDMLTEKQASLDYSLILKNIRELRPETNIKGGSIKQIYNLEKRLDQKILPQCLEVINGKRDGLTLDLSITNEDRAFGSTISYYVSIKHKDKGLPKNSIKIFLKGSAGQSFGAFLVHGIRLELEGDANDYVGKGLSGGKIIIYPPKSATYRTDNSIIVGNVVLYGAVTGKFFIRGQAAERFCVRNSGAIAVSEGCGDHGCEYMTGGIAIILGSTGRNFAAGMSGGIAYIYDSENVFPSKCNKESVSLDKLESGEDLQEVYELLIEFLADTGSKVAEFILKNWKNETNKFVKVFPHEYRKVLENQKSKQGSEIVEIKKEIELKKSEKKVDDIEDTLKNLDKTSGFYKYSRNTNPYRGVPERLKDWKEIYNHVEVHKHLKKQAARCMDCGVPFCQSKDGCPLGNIIPKWNDLVFQDNWKEALEQLLQTNNFPEFTGRVCPAPCEGSCVLGINSKPVTIKNIECAIIDHAFQQGWMKPNIPTKRTGKRCAIIGSGPSGLSAAAQLNKAGHLVTVYERNDVIGGLLRYGIPTMKLSKETVQRRVDLMAMEGVVFKTNIEVGKNIDAQLILNENDAIIMATGSTWPRDLNIPGRELNGIYYAMNFLQSWQHHQETKAQNYDKLKLFAKGKRVIIIGGGDTGCDCIATSLRQECKDVTTFEILPRPPDSRGSDNPWPQWPRVFKLDYGHEETLHLFGKDPRVFLISSKEFIDDGKGNVCGIKTVLIEWKKDDQDRWQTVEVPGSEKIYECDLVLLAMGFLGPEDACIQQLNLKKDSRTNIETPIGKYNTSIAKIYAAGDCRRGQSLVVWAIHEGRQVARQVDYDLMGSSALAGPAGVLAAEMMNRKKIVA